MNRDPKTWNYRYQFEKEGAKSEVLDDKIDEMAEVIRVFYGIGGGLEGQEGEEGEQKKGKTEFEHLELGDPSRSSQQDMVVVGRIQMSVISSSASSANPTSTTTSSSGQDALMEDSTATSSQDDFPILDSFGQPLLSASTASNSTNYHNLHPHLSEANLSLESSRMLGAGTRVPLVISKDCRMRTGPNEGDDDGSKVGGNGKTQLGLYPGMLVGLKGKNGGGDKFTVEEILLVSDRVEVGLSQYALESSD